MRSDLLDKKKYSVTFKSHFRHLWLLFFLLTILPIGIHYLMVFKVGNYTQEAAWFVGKWVFLTFILPMILLHMNHVFKSFGSYLVYENSGGLFVYGNGKSEIRFNLNDIESITCYKSKAMAINKNPSFPWEIYNYAKIKLKDGETIIISSLVVYEFDKEIGFEGITIKNSFYPWIS